MLLTYYVKVITVKIGIYMKLQTERNHLEHKNNNSSSHNFEVITVCYFSCFFSVLTHLVS